ncbi:MAG: valine--tRNA ligase [Coriobacteriaceae bacterium]|nr:valine--tRNA ligase [Coriobacteriaceae bacterium]
MSDMPKNYSPSEIEGPIFERWYAAGYFHRGSEQEPTGKAPYTVTIPPPNVTGVLHMGHALNDTIQDTAVRRARMQGRPTRWILGTDHAAIATQNKVEQRIASEQGKTRHDLGREAFLEECWKWRDEFGGAIIEQIKGMGCSCDYDDEHFTMDENYSRCIRKVFCDWYHDDMIYRGKRIINWCPRCNTALADDEVEYADEDGHLWYVRYPLKEPVGGRDYIVIATTRPETMLGDTGIAVNPSDERYADLVGATVVLPIVGREIPIFADRYVDASFGTGCVKVTPAHDPNDYEMGIRHDLEQINIFDGDARVNEEGGEFCGMDRFEAREAVVARLEELGVLDHVEDHAHSVGHCYRCDTTIEPWLSEQWFVRMKPLADPAMQAVRDGRVRFFPARWEHVYFQWMENVRDWCISRQLWWGHRIPMFYCDSCGFEDALMEDADTCPNCGAPLRQDEDVLDTWFSSQLWPFATMGWLQGGQAEEELETCYPTQMLSTARDIMGLWVARMIMSSLYFMDDIPFTDVIIHPTVLDKQGRRMSKSLGNGVDPLELIDTYGADGMRFGLLMQVTGSQDMKFDEKKLEQSRNFATKIWNAARFVLMNLEDYEDGEPVVECDEDAWILSRLATLAATIDEALDEYSFGAATRALMDFFWNEFCDWYIEFTKPRLNAGGKTRTAAQKNLVFVLDQSLRLLHPMMPFVTEEIWMRLPLADQKPSLMIADWPDTTALARFSDEQAADAIATATSVVSSVRATRARYGISPHEALSVTIRCEDATQREQIERERDLICNLALLDAIDLLDADAPKPADAGVDLVGTLEIYTLLAGLVDMEAERERLLKEKEKTEAELAKLDKKLANENFIAKAAPEAVEKARGQHEELSASLKLIEAQLG